MKYEVKKSTDDNTGYVTWYANFPKFLGETMTRMRDLHEKMLANLKFYGEDLWTLSQSYGADFKSVLSDQDKECVARYYAYHMGLTSVLRKTLLMERDTLKTKWRHETFPGEDISETFEYMLSTKGRQKIDKDPGTRKKAYLILKHLNATFGENNVHIPLSFEEPDEYTMWKKDEQK